MFPFRQVQQEAREFEKPKDFKLLGELCLIKSHYFGTDGCIHYQPEVESRMIHQGFEFRNIFRIFKCVHSFAEHVM